MTEYWYIVTLTSGGASSTTAGGVGSCHLKAGTPNPQLNGANAPASGCRGGVASTAHYGEVSRRDEVFERPLHRTMTAEELRTVRRDIISGTRGVVRGAFLRIATFIGIMTAGYAVQCVIEGRVATRLGKTPVWALGVAAVVILIVVPLLFLLRLLALRDLEHAPLYRTEGPIDTHNGVCVRLRSPAGDRGQHIRPTPGLHPRFDPEYTWGIDFVRTRHGPDWFYVLRSQYVRPATAAERRQLNAYLWQTGVYRDTTSDGD